MDKTDCDIVDVINEVIPGEKHLPGMNYCGPGTRLREKLDKNGKPKPGFEPVDRVDEAALKHDIAYSQYSDKKHRSVADKQFVDELLNIEAPSCRERLERCIVIPFMLLKKFFNCIITLFMRT